MIQRDEHVAFHIPKDFEEAAGIVRARILEICPGSVNILDFAAASGFVDAVLGLPLDATFAQRHLIGSAYRAGFFYGMRQKEERQEKRS